MFLRWLQKLFKGPGSEVDRAFASDVPSLQLSKLDTQESQDSDFSEKTISQEFEVFPADPSVRKQWFSLTIRERQVIALVCMGHRNYEIASILGIGYPTVQTHLQHIFHKFDLRSRQEIQAALISWRAEEWWHYHHY